MAPNEPVTQRKKRRKAPRKRATNQEQVVDQLRRYQRLANSAELGIDVLIKQLVGARARARKYAEKIRYYTERLGVQAGEADRALRAIQLGNPT